MSLKKRSKQTPDERMAYLVVFIIQEGKNKQFRVCLMSQNRALRDIVPYAEICSLPTLAHADKYADMRVWRSIC